MGEPPFSAGAVQDTSTDASCEVPVAAVGALGGPTGVTAADGSDGSLVPMLFVAVTVNVYGVPLTRFVTSHAVVPVVEHVAPPGAAETVYPVIG